MRAILLNILVLTVLSFTACTYENCYECEGLLKGKKECCGKKEDCEGFLSSCEGKGGKIIIGKKKSDEAESNVKKKVDEVQENVNDAVDETQTEFEQKKQRLRLRTKKDK